MGLGWITKTFPRGWERSQQQLKSYNYNKVPINMSRRQWMCYVSSAIFMYNVCTQREELFCFSLSLSGCCSAWTARHCLEDGGCTTQSFLINLKNQTNLIIYLFRKVLKSSSFNQQQRGLMLHTRDAYIIQIYYFHNKWASLAISESKCCFSSQKAHKHWGTTEILYFK